jgi:hypothetical protein
MKSTVHKTAAEAAEREQQPAEDSQTSLRRYDCFNRKTYCPIVASTDGK